jgi:Protein of unknown function (DUF2867)
MPRLISYAARYWSAQERGPFHVGEDVDYFEVIKEHPAVWVMKMRDRWTDWHQKALKKHPDTLGPNGCHAVLRIYSVIEIPDVIYTNEMEDSFQ